MRRLGTLLLALFVLVPAALGADEDPEAAAARAYARERLLNEARQAVGGDVKGPDPFGAMQKALAADCALMMRYDEKKPKTDQEVQLLKEFEQTIKERILLIGWPGDAGGEGASQGALQEAQHLDGWLAGKFPCSVLVGDEGAPGKEQAFLYPPEPPAPPPAPTPPPAAGALESPPPAPGGGPAAPAAAAAPGEAPAAPAPAEPEEAPPEPQTAPAPAAPKEVPPEPRTEPTPPPVPDVDEWAKTVRQEVGGSLRGRVLRPAECTQVPSLLEAASQAPLYRHPDVDGIERHALVAKNVFAYNAPFAALRVLQADERNKAMQEDQPPPSLVDESMVRQKARVVERYKEVVATRQAQRERVTDDLDKMVFALDAWKTQAALLARDIEGMKRALEPKAGDGGNDAAGSDPDAGERGEPAEGAHGPDAVVTGPEGLALRLAEARESMVSMEITLLYMTALRAERRLRLLDRLLKAASEEATAAEQVLARYEAALRALRSARRLDRLNSDERMLLRWIAQLESRTVEEGSPAAKRLAAYQAVLALNRAVQDAVVHRRSMAGGTEPETPQKGKEGGGAGAGASAPPTTEGHQVTPLLRDPRRATWDVKLLQIATRELRDPDLEEEFDARLVAEHYAAVDDQIRATLAALKSTVEEQGLRERFEAARAAADAALAPLQGDFLITRERRLPALLEGAVEDFQAAMAGIDEEQARHRERLDALLAYRKLLLDQGARSLLIRTDRNLSDAEIGKAAEDASYALGRATRWATLDDEDNAAGFLTREWWRVLVLAVALVGVVLLVRVARRRVDGWIERTAAAHPALGPEGASVREEREEARRRREAEQAAAVTATAEEILETTAPEEEAPPEAEPEAAGEEGAAPGDEAGAPAEARAEEKEEKKENKEEQEEPPEPARKKGATS